MEGMCFPSLLQLLGGTRGLAAEMLPSEPDYPNATQTMGRGR